MPRSDDACRNPRLSETIPAFCFDELPPEQRDRMAQHLIECPSCWTAVQRLHACVEAVRFDPRLAPPRPTAGSISLFALSGRLDAWLAGHARTMSVAAALYAALYTIPVFVEIAYEWERFGRTALTFAPLAFIWMFMGTLAAFTVDVRQIRAGRAGMTPVLTCMAIGTILLCAGLLPMFPARPTVAAEFSTYPAFLGYLKSVAYAWAVGPVFVLWPFHIIVTLQREIARGRHRAVLVLLNGEPGALAPRGVQVLPVWVLTALLAGLIAFNWIGVSHLFENLIPSRHTNLFMSLVLLRVGVWLSLAAVGLWWYRASIMELKRECLSVLALGE